MANKDRTPKKESNLGSMVTLGAGEENNRAYKLLKARFRTNWVVCKVQMRGHLRTSVQMRLKITRYTMVPLKVKEQRLSWMYELMTGLGRKWKTLQADPR